MPHWRIASTPLHAGAQRWTLRDAQDAALSNAAVLPLWRQSAAFRELWSAALRALPYPAYCWECPPLSAATAARAYECVIVESPLLQHSRADAQPFAAHFRAGEAAVAFANLGGDTTLIAPSPAPTGDFAHLARFMATAEAAQIHALWALVGERAERAAKHGPVWLSTAGLGVAWLHVRIDPRPKYYRYLPYKDGAVAAERERPRRP